MQGIDPSREATTSTLAEVVTEGAFLSPDDRDGVLVGQTLAKNLNVGIGGELVFIGQGADGSLAAGKLYVRGLFKTGVAELDRTTTAAHIDTIREAFSLTDAATEIAVLLDRERDRPKVAADLRQLIDELGRPLTYDGVKVFLNSQQHPVWNLFHFALTSD